MSRQIHCDRCGFEGRAKTKGSAVVAIFLWLFFIVPGIVYSVWMFSGPRRTCPQCRQPEPMPLDVYRRVSPVHPGAAKPAIVSPNTPISPTEN